VAHARQTVIARNLGCCKQALSVMDPPLQPFVTFVLRFNINKSSRQGTAGLLLPASARIPYNVWS